MDAEGRIVVSYDEPRTAALVAQALAGDDDDFCRTHVDGCRVIAEVRGDGPRSLLRTADDLLSGIAVAEDVMKTGSIGRQNA